MNHVIRVGSRGPLLRAIFLWLVIGAVTAACSAAAGETATTTPTSAPVPSPTPSAVGSERPTQTPTSKATATKLPSPTLTPSPTEEAGPARIEFEPGATTWNIEFEPGARGVQQFVLRALSGQAMQVVTHPWRSLSIVGADGADLVGPDTYPMFWRGQLPSTQDYIITLNLGEEASKETQSLFVAIAPLGQPSQSFDYVDKKHRFSLTYSDYFTIVDNPTLFPTTRGDLVLNLLLVGNEYYDGTNLSLSYIYVAASDDPQVLQVCSEGGSPYGEPQGEVEVNSVVYAVTSYGEAGVGNLWVQTTHSTRHADRCYEVIFLTHSHAIGGYEPGTVTEFDSDGLFSKMQAVFESLKLLDE